MSVAPHTAARCESASSSSSFFSFFLDVCPRSFNAGKAEAAGGHLKAALACPSLPPAQRPEVEAQAEEARSLLMALNPTCSPS